MQMNYGTLESLGAVGQCLTPGSLYTHQRSAPKGHDYVTALDEGCQGTDSEETPRRKAIDPEEDESSAFDGFTQMSQPG